MVIDGISQEDIDDKKVEIVVLCNVEKIISEESINIKGDVTGNIEGKTSVNCDAVIGDVRAGMSINCDSITGNATAGMSINCGNATANKINR